MCLFGVIKLKFNIKPLFIPKNRQIWARNTLDLVFSDVSLAVNLCINCSFFTFISPKLIEVGIEIWYAGGCVGLQLMQEAQLSQRGRAMLRVCL